MFSKIIHYPTILLITFPNQSLPKRQTHDINLPLCIPTLIKLPLTSIQLHIRYLERNRHIRLSCKQYILEVIVRRLDLLLIGGHKSVLGFCVWLDLWVLDLE